MTDETEVKTPRRTADLMSSLVLFLIGIPLNLGIALASGVSATAGLISGVIGGIVVGIMAGCPLQVTGPATGLIAMVWQIIERHGLENLGLVVFLAGVIQILIGYFRIGPWFRAVSPAVIQGMLAGIGVLIFASQFHVMMDAVPETAGIANLLAIPGTIYESLFPGRDSVQHIAAFIGLMTIVLVVVWNRFAVGRMKVIPGALIGVAVATLVTQVLNLPITFVIVPDSLFDDISFLSPTQASLLMEPSIWLSVFALTFIASAQTLLTSTAVSKLAPHSPTDYNREVMAQGTGNAVAGLLGVLPMSGVIVRSAANVQVGAQTRWSAVMHGGWILLFILFFAAFLRMIPIASLAAVLVYTGCKLVNPRAVRDLAQFGMSEVAIYGATVLAIVVTDLLTGILIGFGLATAKLIYVLTHCDITVRGIPEYNRVEVDIHGSATFFTLPVLAATLEEIQSGTEVHIFLSDLNYIDHACLEQILVWERKHIEQGGSVVLEWDYLAERFQEPLTKKRRDDLPTPAETDPV